MIFDDDDEDDDEEEEVVDDDDDDLYENESAPVEPFLTPLAVGLLVSNNDESLVFLNTSAGDDLSGMAPTVLYLSVKSAGLFVGLMPLFC